MRKKSIRYRIILSCRHRFVSSEQPDVKGMIVCKVCDKLVDVHKVVKQ